MGRVYLLYFILILMRYVKVNGVYILIELFFI